MATSVAETDPFPLPDRAGRDVVVVCRARDLLVALAAQDVVETMRPQPIQPLASVPAFVLGVAIIRGVPVPVVDAGALLGAVGAPRPTRLVTIRTGGRQVALAVEEVLGVRALARGPVHDLPPLLTRAGADTIAAIASLDAQLLMVLQATRLMPPTVWDLLEQRA
jgi:purine-binding chemotaxis protein CheW